MHKRTTHHREARGKDPSRSLFSSLLARTIARDNQTPRAPEPPECHSLQGTLCSLCHASVLSYDLEARLKNAALERYLGRVFGRSLSPLVPSPRGRRYRTVTKRKAFYGHDGLRLGLIDPSKGGIGGSFEVGACAIEPDRHRDVYAQLREVLTTSRYRSFAEILRYVIIKGSYDVEAVIFSVREVNQQVVKTVNSLSKHLTRQCKTVESVWLAGDSSDGRYYLGESGGRGGRLMKIHGRSELFHRVDGKTFLYPPEVFSQVNHSLLGSLVQHTRSLLSPSTTDVLMDLYSGYGLFALCLSSSVARVTGIEESRASVQAAVNNAKRQRTANCRFIAQSITTESIRDLLERSSPFMLAILDPPRNGTAADVIEAIADHRPRKVVHAFCNIDLIGKEMARWRKKRYEAVRAIPFDMFPGTDSVEVLVLLEPMR